MKTDPKLTQGYNKLWIKFFLTAVFSTMYVRDHQRPAFHDALGVDVDWYGQEVFRKTSDITTQIFPMMLDIDHPRWMPNLKRMQRASTEMAAADRKSGLGRLIGKALAGAKAGYAFVALYTIPSVKVKVPAKARMQPSY